MKRKFKTKRKKSIIKIILLIFFVLLMLLGMGIIALQVLYNRTNYDSDDFGSYPSILKDNRYFNVLLVGLDEIQEKQRGRSDSMMIISLDSHHKKIKITSLMRDLWVPIPGHGFSKLNSAYSYGGVNCLSGVIRSIFGVTIDRYVIVDFNKFEQVIDKIGGLDLNLTSSEVKYINSISRDKNLTGSGLMHLNGNQTLSYSRDRDDPSADFKRTERQRYVIESIINKMKSLNIVDLISISQDIMKQVKTNFTISEIMSLVKNSRQFTRYPVIMNRIPHDFECKNINKQSVLVALPNLDACKDSILSFIYEELYLKESK